MSEDYQLTWESRLNCPYGGFGQIVHARVTLRQNSDKIDSPNFRFQDAFDPIRMSLHHEMLLFDPFILAQCLNVNPGKIEDYAAH